MAFIDLDKDQIDIIISHLDSVVSKYKSNGEHLNAHKVNGIIGELRNAVPDYIAFDAEEMMAQDAMR